MRSAALTLRDCLPVFGKEVGCAERTLWLRGQDSSSGQSEEDFCSKQIAPSAAAGGGLKKQFRAPRQQLAGATSGIQAT
jgi:hypothetical protein